MATPTHPSSILRTYFYDLSLLPVTQLIIITGNSDKNNKIMHAGVRVYCTTRGNNIPSIGKTNIKYIKHI